MCRSEPQRLAIVTLINTSSGPGSGTSYWVSAMPRAFSRVTAALAFIASPSLLIREMCVDVTVATAAAAHKRYVMPRKWARDDAMLVSSAWDARGVIDQRRKSGVLPTFDRGPRPAQRLLVE